MSKLKRFLLFLASFAVIVAMAQAINFHLGNLIAGAGFTIAYLYGEKHGE